VSPQNNIMKNAKNLVVVMYVSQTYIPLFYNKSLIYHFHVLYTHNPCIHIHKVRTSLEIDHTHDRQVRIQGFKKPYICSFQHMKTWHCCLNNYARIPTLKPHVINAQVLNTFFVLLGPFNTHTSITIYNHILFIKIETIKYTTSFPISFNVMKFVGQTKIFKMKTS
jgi:hypothetical protein